MEALELNLIAKKQELEDVLTYALNHAPVYLTVVKKLKEDIEFCDLALKELRSKKAFSALLG